MKTEIQLIAIVTSALLLSGTPAFASAGEDPVILDPALKDYRPVSGISGNLNSVGSDTLNNLMTLWAEGFQKYYPNVKIQIEGKGSSTAPPALIAGTSQLGPMSRKMKLEEVDAFDKAYGYKPRMISVALDGLAVYVHKDNPVRYFTMQQLDSVFSTTRKLGGKRAETWGDLGLTGEWENRPLSIYGRNSASGTYGFFKDNVLRKGDYKPSVKEQPGSASVVQGVENELGGIGYSGIGYKTSGVRIPPVAFRRGPIKPTQKTVESFDYPISRYLYVYINKDPIEGTDPLVREFLKYVLSKQGQEVVIKDGYFPLDAKKIDEMLNLVN